MLWVGIDPGLHGAIAFIRETSLQTRTYSVADMPINESGIDATELYFLLHGHAMDLNEDVRVCIEQCINMPKQGARQRTTTGIGYGVLLGVLGALRLKYVSVLPVVWKRSLGLLGQDKTASREKAMELYPATCFKKKKQHNQAEALLLAHYARTVAYEDHA